MSKMLKAINNETIPIFHIESYGSGSWRGLILIPALWSSSISLKASSSMWPQQK